MPSVQLGNLRGRDVSGVGTINKMRNEHIRELYDVKQELNKKTNDNIFFLCTVLCRPRH